TGLSEANRSTKGAHCKAHPTQYRVAEVAGSPRRPKAIPSGADLVATLPTLVVAPHSRLVHHFRGSPHPLAWHCQPMPLSNTPYRVRPPRRTLWSRLNTSRGALDCSAVGNRETEQALRARATPGRGGGTAHDLPGQMRFTARSITSSAGSAPVCDGTLPLAHGPVGVSNCAGFNFRAPRFVRWWRPHSAASTTGHIHLQERFGSERPPHQGVDRHRAGA